MSVRTGNTDTTWGPLGIKQGNNSHHPTLEEVKEGEE